MSDSTGCDFKFPTGNSLADKYPATYRYFCEKVPSAYVATHFHFMPEEFLKAMEDSLLDGEFRLFVPITRDVEFRWSQTHKSFVKEDEM